MGARKGREGGWMVGEGISVCLWFCMKGEGFCVQICVCKASLGWEYQFYKVDLRENRQDEKERQRPRVVLC